MVTQWTYAPYSSFVVHCSCNSCCYCCWCIVQNWKMIEHLLCLRGCFWTHRNVDAMNKIEHAEEIHVWNIAEYCSMVTKLMYIRISIRFRSFNRTTSSILACTFQKFRFDDYVCGASVTDMILSRFHFRFS